MKYIYLLRHGEAEKNDYLKGKDARRKLTASGHRMIREEAKAMRRLKVEPNLILTSPLVRARETAQIVAKELKVTEPVQDCLQLAPGHHPSDLIRYLSRHQDIPSILLVGHEPNMGHLLSTLVDRTGHPHIIFEKGGLASLKCKGRFIPAKECSTGSSPHSSFV